MLSYTKYTTSDTMASITTTLGPEGVLYSEKFGILN